MKTYNIEIGDPVHVLFDNKHDDWVGYVRRINRVAKCAEVGPETTISHLHTYELSRLVPAKFTRFKNPRLADEITRLRAMEWDETGRAVGEVVDDTKGGATAAKCQLSAAKCL